MTMIGLDIGSKSIKIVELEKSGNNWTLKASGVVGYSGKTPEQIEDEREFSALSGVIKKLHKDAKISKREIAIALPETQVFTRTIKFPLLTDQEISSAVKWEAEQYIPIPVNEAIVQHKILDRNDKSTPPQVNVLLVAAPQALVEKYIKTVQMANLNPVIIETELISLVRSLAPMDQVVMVIDFGARSTDIAIARNGNLVFSRSIPTAGDAFTRAVAQGLGIEVAQAEEYKKTYGLSSSQLEGKIKGALDPVIRMVTDEIKKSVHFYQTEEKGDAPKSIIVSGGSAGMPDVISVLSRSLNMEVVMGNPFAKVTLTPDVAKSLANYAPLYSIAIGLAEGG